MGRHMVVLGTVRNKGNSLRYGGLSGPAASSVVRNAHDRQRRLMWRRSGDFGPEPVSTKKTIIAVSIRSRCDYRENFSANSEARRNASSCRRKTFGKRSAAADAIS